MAKTNLRTQLTLTIAAVVLLAIALISLLSQFYINQRFKLYISVKQANTTQSLVQSLAQRFDPQRGAFDTDSVHTVGMYALYDGYIIKLYDYNHNIIWDAEACDFSACSRVMGEISHRMRQAYPSLNGQFTSNDYPLTVNGKEVGTASISYYGPYFISADDYTFIRELNLALAVIAAVSLVIAAVAGFYVARRISRPILRTAEVARQISGGDYAARIKGDAGSGEIEQLVGSINLLADSLGKQENLRRQLTADVAHELRTPLATLQTHMEAMTEGIWQPTPERLQSCHEEIVRLTGLVKDLESLANAESGLTSLNKTTVSLAQLVSQVIKSFELKVKEQALTVTLHGSCPDILADGDRLTQVIVNLLFNAIKYTPEGGEIDITLSEGERTVTMAVKDSGCGIDEKDLPLIFERFYRADKSRSRLTGGSGIGLSIVKSIITAHGGTVAAESKLGKGSQFTVTLPKEL